MYQERIGLAVFLSAVLFASAARGGEDDLVEIGQLGSTLELSGEWKRQTLIATLGPDQFVRPGKLGGIHLVALEVTNLVDGKAGVLAQLELTVEGMMEAVEEVVQVDERFHEKIGDTHHAVAAFRIKMSGVEIAYEVHYVSVAGLSYILMAWAASSQVVELEEELEWVVAGLRFPPDGSEWAESSKTKTHELETEGFVVRFAVAPAILAEASGTGDTIMALESAGGELDAYFLEMSTDDLDAAFESVRALLDSDSRSLLMSSQREVEVGGYPAIESWFREDASVPTNYHVIQVALEESIFLDIRFVYGGPIDEYERFRAGLIESIEIEKPRGQDAFPIVRDESDVDDDFSERTQRLIGASRRVAEFSEVPVSSLITPERVFVATSGSVASIDRSSGLVEVLFTEEEWRRDRSIAVQGSRLLSSGSDGSVVALLGPDLVGNKEGRPLTGNYVDQPLLVQRSKAPGRLELAVDPESSGRAELVSVGSGGAAHAPIDLGREVDVTCLDGSGAFVLVASNESWEYELRALGARSIEPPTTVFEDRWSSVEMIVPEDRGWLVTGAPEGQPAGVWLMTRGGKKEPILLHDAARGIGLVGGKLWFSLFAFGVDGSRWIVFEAATADIDTWQAENRELDVTTVDAAAVRAASELKLDLRENRTVDGMGGARQLVRAADRALRESAGRELPTSVDSVDSLLTDWILRDGRLPAASRLLAQALVVRALEDAGGEWVSGAAEVRSRWDDPVLPSNPWSISIRPSKLIEWALEDESFSVVGSELSRAAGRTILVGESLSALRAAVEKHVSGDLDQTVLEGPLDGLVVMLRAAPDNEFLREASYRRLAEVGRSADLLAVCEPYATLEDAGVVDLRAYLGALMETAVDGGEVGHAIQATKEAIRRFPGVPVFYLLLGDAYGKRSAKDDDARQRVCYRKVLDLTYGYGPLAEAAERSLGRVNNGR